jgi:hypothetical protein
LTSGVKKTTFLLEEVIDENTEGPFRKYLNNVSPEPLMMKTRKDEALKSKQNFWHLVSMCNIGRQRSRYLYPIIKVNNPSIKN